MHPTEFVLLGHMGKQVEVEIIAGSHEGFRKFLEFIKYPEEHPGGS